MNLQDIAICCIHYELQELLTLNPWTILRQQCNLFGWKNKKIFINIWACCFAIKMSLQSNVESFVNAHINVRQLSKLHHIKNKNKTIRLHSWQARWSWCGLSSLLVGGDAYESFPLDIRLEGIVTIWIQNISRLFTL